jgi:hypothetical protein
VLDARRRGRPSSATPRIYVSLETSLGPKKYALGSWFRAQPDSDFIAEAKALLGEAAIL